MADADLALLAKARNFDLDALGEIYDRYSPGVYRYAVRLLGDVQLAEECVSETFSRFLTALRAGGGPQDCLQAYLYRVAHNWITDQYRRKPPSALPLDDALPAGDNDPELAASDPYQRQRVRAALACLTADQRQVIALKFLEGLDNEAIAEVLQKPVGAVKALQHRAMASLRRILLSEEEFEHETG